MRVFNIDLQVYETRKQKMSLANLKTLFATTKQILKSTRTVAKISPANNLTSSPKPLFCDKCIECVRTMHTTSRNYDLNEFFDRKENWGMDSVKTGRNWNVDELQIKSNEDIHKLWYVLLKERNMLMTMKGEYDREFVEFPNPERIFKVEESMRNIMFVIKEREKALNLLETGETGEPKYTRVMNFLGLRYNRQLREHLFPWYMNTRYRMLHPRYEKWMPKYLKLYREKQIRRAQKEGKRRAMFLAKLKDKYPQLEEKDLKYAWEMELEEEKKLGSYNLTAKEEK